MSVTTTYGFHSSSANPVAVNLRSWVDDVIATDSGGYATTVSFRTLDFTFGDFQISGAASLGMIDISSASLAQLSNGDIVVAGTQVPSILTPALGSAQFSIYTSNGVFVSNTGLGVEYYVDDVAALAGGGFVVVKSDNASTLTDISIRTNTGSVTSSFTIAEAVGVDRLNETVVALEDGGFAMAWLQRSGSTTTIWKAVYEASGAVRQAPSAVTPPFPAVGAYETPTLLALSNGTFALAYGATAGADDAVILQIYDANGALVQQQSVVDTDFNSAALTGITQLPNGFILLAYSDQESAIPHTYPDTSTTAYFVRVFDPVANTFSERTGFANNGFGSFGFPASVAPVVATLNSGEVVLYQTLNNSTEGGDLGLIDGRILNTYRYSVGDSANEVIIGDELTDIMRGGGGADQLSGAAGKDQLSGEAGADTLFGGDGDDRLDGGADIDSMSGGAGNDVYVVDNAGDVVLESFEANSFDWVASRVSYALSASVDVEKLSTTAAAGSTAINLTGNAYTDLIEGNQGINILKSLGGSGTMSGFGGNDIYYVDNILDTVIESSGGGSDFIYASVNYTLAANTERLYLTGTANINGTGINGQADVLTGNSGNNILNGLTGNDVHRGGLGHDTYMVDSTTDVVEEGTNAGTDIIKSTATFTMTLNTERLFLLGSAAIDGTGLATKNDLIVGNNGANKLNGLTGNDTLIGGLGADAFLFNTALNAATNHDTITDFNVAADTIQLENAIFTLLAATGTLATGSFEANSIAGQNGSEVVIYDKANGDLFYDTNGAGTAGGLVLFADVANNTALTAVDFFVV